jgi:hypothetical protein
VIVKVRQEASASAILRMRDIVARHWTLTCNLTYSRHLSVHQKKERQDTKGLGLKQHAELHKS